MTRNGMPVRQRQCFVRSEVRPVSLDATMPHADMDPGYVRSQASRNSLKRSRVMHATDEQQQPARQQMPARYRHAGFVQSRVTSATTPYESPKAPDSSSNKHFLPSTSTSPSCNNAVNSRSRPFERSPVVSISMGYEDPTAYSIGAPSMRHNSHPTPVARRAIRLADSTSSFDPAAYTQPFIRFMTENPTAFHAIDTIGSRLEAQGYKHISERDEWQLEQGGKYYFTRNGSGMIAFSIGSNWKPGSRAAVIASHIDALTARVKPVSNKPTSQGYVQLGVAHYGGALSNYWIDRDLSIGGRVFVRDAKSGKIKTRLVKLPHPVATIPSIAPHFGLGANGQENRETRMVPIVGLDNSDISAAAANAARNPPKDSDASYGFGFSAFASTQPPRLVKAIASELDVSPSAIVNWELEMYSAEPATVLGLDKELIAAGRIDDKLCSWAATEALIASEGGSDVLKIVGLFDDEEVGSLMRQGARSNFLPVAVERICESLGGPASSANRTFAKSFMISADVCHAYNPNYADVYLHDHTPRLNVGVAISFDSNAHMSTDGVSSTILAAIAEKSGSTLQPFQIRNDSRSGGTVGPMLSAATGMRAVDAGIPQLCMHSIRATTGSLDPGLGVKLFKGFFDHYEAVDQEVQQE